MVLNSDIASLEKTVESETYHEVHVSFSVIHLSSYYYIYHLLQN